MKIIDQLESSLERELDVFYEINHENIVKYFDRIHHMNIEKENLTFLVTEYCQVSR